MYEFEQNKKNNLILYGITIKNPETSESLKARVVTLFKDHLNIRRDITVVRAARIHTGLHQSRQRKVSHLNKCKQSKGVGLSNRADQTWCHNLVSPYWAPWQLVSKSKVITITKPMLCWKTFLKVPWGCTVFRKLHAVDNEIPSIGSGLLVEQSRQRSDV